MTTQWQRRSSLIPGNSRPLGIVNTYAHGNIISFSSDTASLLTFLIVILHRQVLSTHNVLRKTKKLYIISTLRAVVPQKKKHCCGNHNRILYKYFFCCHLVVPIQNRCWYALYRKCWPDRIYICFASHPTPGESPDTIAFTLKTNLMLSFT